MEADLEALVELAKDRRYSGLLNDSVILSVGRYSAEPIEVSHKYTWYYNKFVTLPESGPLRSTKTEQILDEWDISSQELAVLHALELYFNEESSRAFSALRDTNLGRYPTPNLQLCSLHRSKPMRYLWLPNVTETWVVADLRDVLVGSIFDIFALTRGPRLLYPKRSRVDKVVRTTTIVNQCLDGLNSMVYSKFSPIVLKDIAWYHYIKALSESAGMLQFPAPLMFPIWVLYVFKTMPSESDFNTRSAIVLRNGEEMIRFVPHTVTQVEAIANLVKYYGTRESDGVDKMFENCIQIPVFRHLAKSLQNPKAYETFVNNFRGERWSKVFLEAIRTQVVSVSLLKNRAVVTFGSAEDRILKTHCSMLVSLQYAFLAYDVMNSDTIKGTAAFVSTVSKDKYAGQRYVQWFFSLVTPGKCTEYPHFPEDTRLTLGTRIKDAASAVAERFFGWLRRFVPDGVVRVVKTTAGFVQSVFWLLQKVSYVKILVCIGYRLLRGLKNMAAGSGVVGVLRVILQALSPLLGLYHVAIQNETIRHLFASIFGTDGYLLHAAKHWSTFLNSNSSDPEVFKEAMVETAVAAAGKGAEAAAVATGVSAATVDQAVKGISWLAVIRDTVINLPVEIIKELYDTTLRGLRLILEEFTTSDSSLRTAVTESVMIIANVILRRVVPQPGQSAEMSRKDRAHVLSTLASLVALERSVGVEALITIKFWKYAVRGLSLLLYKITRFGIAKFVNTGAASLIYARALALRREGRYLSTAEAKQYLDRSYLSQSQVTDTEVTLRRSAELMLRASERTDPALVDSVAALAAPRETFYTKANAARETLRVFYDDPIRLLAGNEETTSLVLKTFDTVYSIYDSGLLTVFGIAEFMIDMTAAFVAPTVDTIHVGVALGSIVATNIGVGTGLDLLCSPNEMLATAAANISPDGAVGGADLKTNKIGFIGGELGVSVKDLPIDRTYFDPRLREYIERFREHRGAGLTVGDVQDQVMSNLASPVGTAPPEVFIPLQSNDPATIVASVGEYTLYLSDGFQFVGIYSPGKPDISFVPLRLTNPNFQAFAAGAFSCVNTTDVDFSADDVAASLDRIVSLGTVEKPYFSKTPQFGTTLWMSSEFMELHALAPVQPFPVVTMADARNLRCADTPNRRIGDAVVNKVTALAPILHNYLKKIWHEGNGNVDNENVFLRILRAIVDLFRRRVPEPTAAAQLTAS